MKKVAFGIVAILLFALPFLIVPTGWTRGSHSLCLKEALVFGFSLLGYYWLFWALGGRIWARISGNLDRKHLTAFMVVGLAIVVIYAWIMTNWDWDIRYLWTACQILA